MVLVHVTNSKGQHKIENRWEHREYVLEWQPYPNLPMYVVNPMDGEGHIQTLHRNYLLPISTNLEQAKDKNSVVGVQPTPVPQAHSELLAGGPTKG